MFVWIIDQIYAYEARKEEKIAFKNWCVKMDRNGVEYSTLIKGRRLTDFLGLDLCWRLFKDGFDTATADDCFRNFLNNWMRRKETGLTTMQRLVEKNTRIEMDRKKAVEFERRSMGKMILRKGQIVSVADLGREGHVIGISRGFMDAPYYHVQLNCDKDRVPGIDDGFFYARQLNFDPSCCEKLADTTEGTTSNPEPEKANG